VIPAFDARSLERRYAFLDDCPESLLQDVVTLPIGTLQERVAGVRRWREALLAGRLPSESEPWPSGGTALPVRRALAELNLVRFCKDQPEIVDALLKDILVALAGHSAVLRGEIADALRKLEALERTRHEGLVQSVRLDDETVRRLRAQAEREVGQRDRGADATLIDAWGERARAWAAITEVFGDLGQMLGRGWDLTQGVLRHTGWLDLLRLRKLVEQLPQLREIVRALGRLQVSTSHEASIAEKVLAPVKRLEEERREVRSPAVPTETRGVERSGEIARMLPIEASMLGHPRLRMLWHARRAERALLTYRVEGVEVERVEVERESDEERVRPRPERGPILAVIDTSGSMHGLPERVAKALVLEALRTAHAEKRACFLYAYSGPGQVLEQELDLSPDGVGRLMGFLGFSFGGGNDEAGVLTRVLARLEDSAFRKADVVFVSDGEWPAPTTLLDSVAKAKEAGTRFHGVQIGNLGQTGLHAVCDPVHVFQDWAAAGGWRG
jgi:uncharacterized protein with von Willebrand factor type A (vWA) domain